MQELELVLKLCSDLSNGLRSSPLSFREDIKDAEVIEGEVLMMALLVD